MTGSSNSSSTDENAVKVEYSGLKEPSVYNYPKDQARRQRKKQQDSAGMCSTQQLFKHLCVKYTLLCSKKYSYSGRKNCTVVYFFYRRFHIS